jgi:hypothetical protein
MSCGRSARSRRRSGPTLHEVAALVGRHRPGEQKALAYVTPLRLEPHQLGLILDALGDCLDPERAPELDEGADQRVALGRALDL